MQGNFDQVTPTVGCIEKSRLWFDWKVMAAEERECQFSSGIQALSGYHAPVGIPSPRHRPFTKWIWIMGVGRRERQRHRGKETEKGGWDLEGKMLVGNGTGIGEEGMGNWIYQLQYMYAWILNKLFFDSGPSSAEASSTCMREFLSKGCTSFPGAVWGWSHLLSRPAWIVRSYEEVSYALHWFSGVSSDSVGLWQRRGGRTEHWICRQTT